MKNEDLSTIILKSDWCAAFLLVYNLRVKWWVLISFERHEVEDVAHLREHIQEQEVKDGTHIPSENETENSSSTVQLSVEISSESDQEPNDSQVRNAREGGNDDLSGGVDAEGGAESGGVLDEHEQHVHELNDAGQLEEAYEELQEWQVSDVS